MNPLILPEHAAVTPTPVIVALDFDNADATLAFVRQLDPTQCQVKIGKELFTATGRSLAESLVTKALNCFWI